VSREVYRPDWGTPATSEESGWWDSVPEKEEQPLPPLPRKQNIVSRRITRQEWAEQTKTPSRIRRDDWGRFASTDVDRRSGLDAVLDNLPDEVADEFRESQAGPAFHLREVASTLSVLDELTPYELSEMERTWAYLPDAVQAAILRELGTGGAGSVRMPHADVVSAFAASAEGSTLRKVWGDPSSRRYARNVGRIFTRLSNIKKDAGYGRHVDEWLNSMSPQQIIACCVALAGDPK